MDRLDLVPIIEPELIRVQCEFVMRVTIFLLKYQDIYDLACQYLDDIFLLQIELFKYKKKKIVINNKKYLKKNKIYLGGAIGYSSKK